MYILRPDIPEEEVESHLTKYRDMLVETGAEVLDNQMRGKRRLAYLIGKHREGVYIQLNYSGDGKQVGPLEKAMRLSEDVIRYLTVKYDGQHSSLGRSTAPANTMASNTPRTEGQEQAKSEPQTTPA